MWHFFTNGGVWNTMPTCRPADLAPQRTLNPSSPTIQDASEAQAVQAPESSLKVGIWSRTTHGKWKNHIFSGWWLRKNPSEKYESQLGWLFPINGKNKTCSKPPTSSDQKKTWPNSEVCTIFVSAFLWRNHLRIHGQIGFCCLDITIVMSITWLPMNTVYCVLRCGYGFHCHYHDHYQRSYSYIMPINMLCR